MFKSLEDKSRFIVNTSIDQQNIKKLDISEHLKDKCYRKWERDNLTCIENMEDIERSFDSDKKRKNDSSFEVNKKKRNT